VVSDIILSSLCFIIWVLSVKVNGFHCKMMSYCICQHCK
jgi:hypothetical protein